MHIARTRLTYSHGRLPLLRLHRPALAPGPPPPRPERLPVAVPLQPPVNVRLPLGGHLARPVQEEVQLQLGKEKRNKGEERQLSAKLQRFSHRV